MFEIGQRVKVIKNDLKYIGINFGSVGVVLSNKKYPVYYVQFECDINNAYYVEEKMITNAKNVNYLYVAE